MAPQEPTIVSGSASTVAGLGKDETWLKDWLAEDPSRLGIGAVTILDHEPVQGDDGNPAFLAADEGRYFSVNVHLGEVDASHGFHVLDSWARNRVRHPDKTHVAVLVTEQANGRYHTALEALSEHLPMVVVELQCWRGKNEAIVAPRIVLASEDLDFAKAPADVSADLPVVDAQRTPHKGEPAADGSRPEVGEPGVSENKVDDPWKLPARAAETLAPTTNGT